jgi:hypothetical protein
MENLRISPVRAGEIKKSNNQSEKLDVYCSNSQAPAQRNCLTESGKDKNS